MRARSVSTSGLFVVVVALSAALALGVAPSAQAANIVPNPGFEVNCSGIPCQWLLPTGATFTRDTSAAHTGQASLRLASDGTDTFQNVRSDCVAVTPGTTYNVGVWYRTSSTINLIQFRPIYFSQPGCTGGQSQPGALSTNTPLTDGSWHHISTQHTSPSGNPISAQSAILTLEYQCAATCTGTAVNFDDANWDSESLAATVRSVSATRSRKGVVVRWRTGTEVDVLGYDVFRQRVGRHRVRVNKRLLPAQLTRGGVSGGAYSFVDRRAPKNRALRYWLQEVDVRGHRTWHGPVRVRAS